MILAWCFRSVLYYKLGQSGLKWSMYSGPYSGWSWLGFIGGMAFAVFCYIVTELVNADFIQFDGYLAIHAGLCQGASTDPAKGSSRVVFCTMFGFGLLIWASYSSVLTSYLAIKVQPPPFYSLEEMLYKTSYKIVTPPSTGEVDHFKVNYVAQEKKSH